MGGQVRPLGLFEVLTRNRQSAVGRRGRTICTRLQPPRMCTILPRKRLSSPTQLAIRTRRVTRIQNQNQNQNNYTPPSSIKPPRPRTTPLERNTEHTLTHPPQKFPLCTHSTLILKHGSARAKEKEERQNTRETLSSKSSFYSLLASSRWCSALSNAQHDGRVRKFLRYTRGA